MLNKVSSFAILLSFMFVVFVSNVQAQGEGEFVKTEVSPDYPHTASEMLCIGEKEALYYHIENTSPKRNLVYAISREIGTFKTPVEREIVKIGLVKAGQSTNGEMLRSGKYRMHVNGIYGSGMLKSGK